MRKSVVTITSGFWSTKSSHTRLKVLSCCGSCISNHNQVSLELYILTPIIDLFAT